jgi:hypothetical protein
MGSNFAKQFQDPEVLDNQRIRARGNNGRAGACGFTEFMFENQRIESDVAPDAALMQCAHHVWQLFQREACFGPRREMLQPEIHRIRARLDCRAQLGPITGRTHDFRF